MHQEGPNALYTSGTYLAKNPNWHIEESGWKAKLISQMLADRGIAPARVCELGCGAGEVLAQLQLRLGADCDFWGFDISPQALEMCRARANNHLHFALIRPDETIDARYDLILLLDLIEHLEDYFALLRKIRQQAEYKIFHIPLDLSLQSVLRRNGLLKVRDWYGHLHYFSKDTALQTLRESGYEVLDYHYTARALDLPTRELVRKLMRLPRRALYALNHDLAVRILGGWSLLVLTK